MTALAAALTRAEELLRRAAKVVETSPETPIFAAELTAAAEELAALTRPAGGEEVEFPYQRTFNAIGDAVTIEGSHIAISVRKFQESYNRAALATPQQVKEGDR